MLDTRVQLPSFSMWAQTPIYEIEVNGENVVVFGLLQDAVVADATDQTYTVPQAGVYRLDLLSQGFYGVPDLWPVIARANNLVDAIVGFAQGDKIRVPTKARLAQEGLLSV
jgi:hypothetical protein